jgi:hypothetical protein
MDENLNNFQVAFYEASSPDLDSLSSIVELCLSKSKKGYKVVLLIEESLKKDLVNSVHRAVDIDYDKEVSILSFQTMRQVSVKYMANIKDVKSFFAGIHFTPEDSFKSAMKTSYVAFISKSTMQNEDAFFREISKVISIAKNARDWMRSKNLEVEISIYVPSLASSNDVVMNIAQYYGLALGATIT